MNNREKQIYCSAFVMMLAVINLGLSVDGSWFQWALGGFLAFVALWMHTSWEATC